MLEAIDARAARQWALTALAALAEAREELDALNVFPVPDGDTGTNLYLTFEAAVDAVSGLSAEAGVREVLAAFAHGALMGARGNSGIIAAQLLRGWADVLADRESLDGPAVAQAARRADQQAWRAVADPVEGTILSVSAAAAEAAGRAGDRLADVVAAMVASAREALARTPAQLEVLHQAGVVDAGGQGYLVVLETLEDLVHHRRAGGWGRRVRSPRAEPRLPEAGPCAGAGMPLGIAPAFEVMYLLEAAPEEADRVRGRLALLGESLVVAGGDRVWHVHVHTDDPGAAVEAGVEAGRPSRIRIVGLTPAGRVAPGGARVGTTQVALVACATGPGLARLFADAGAVVVTDGDRRPWSTARLVEAIGAAHRLAETVVVLPNDPDALTVAGAAAAGTRAGGVRVTVLPTRTQVQGLAAAAVHDPRRTVDEDVVAMSAAAGATRDGAVTVATGEAMTMAGVCRRGDVLGLVQGDIVSIGDEVGAVAAEVLDRMLTGGGELVSLVLGTQAPPGLAATLAARVRRSHPGVEVTVLDGGQPRHPILIGVE